MVTNGNARSTQRNFDFCLYVCAYVCVNFLPSCVYQMNELCEPIDMIWSAKTQTEIIVACNAYIGVESGMVIVTVKDKIIRSAV